MKNGFTLIEILVVVTIMGVLMAAGVASYNTLNERAKVEEAARSLESQLRSWQKEADAGVGAENCAVGTPFTGILVTLTTGATVTAAAMCGAASTALPSFTIPNAVLPQSGTNFTLMPLGQGVSPAARTIVLARNGIRYQVSISTGGGMSVSKL